MKKNKKIFKFIPVMIALAIVLSAFSFVGCSMSDIAPVAQPEGTLEVEVLDEGAMTLSAGETTEVELENGTKYIKAPLTALLVVGDEEYDSNYNYKVSWSIAWEDSSITLNLSDYVTISGTAFYSRDVEVKCHAPFSNPVIVTARLDMYDLEVSCRVTYIGIPSKIDVDQTGVGRTILGDYSSTVLGLPVATRTIYKLYEDIEYVMPIDMENILGDIGDYGFEPDFSARIEGVASVKYTADWEVPAMDVDKHFENWIKPVWEGKSGTLRVGDADTFNITQDLAQISFDGRNLVIKPICAPDNVFVNKVFNDNTQRLNFVEHSTTLHNWRISGENAESYMYHFQATITEENTGISTTFFFAIMPGVESFSLDSFTITF